MNTAMETPHALQDTPADSSKSLGSVAVHSAAANRTQHAQPVPEPKPKPSSADWAKHMQSSMIDVIPLRRTPFVLLGQPSGAPQAMHV
jgi:hypothetical protein